MVGTKPTSYSCIYFLNSETGDLGLHREWRQTRLFWAKYNSDDGILKGVHSTIKCAVRQKMLAFLKMQNT